MKSKLFKRLLAVALTLSMVLCLTACISGPSYPEGDYDFSTTGTTLRKPGGSIFDDDDDDDIGNSGNTDTDASDDTLVQASQLSDPNLRYVMVYNPKVYDEYATFDRSALKIGALGAQIDVEANRADGLETTPPFDSISQLDWFKDFPKDVELDGDRADPMGINYKKGDTHDFYYSSRYNVNTRQKGTFTCVYSGEHCHIWTIDPTISATDINDLGTEFDRKVYQTVVNTFGKARFVGETGKVNLLLYDMQDTLGGYFAPRDLFTEAELPMVGLSGMDCNTGHAVVHINVDFLRGNEANRRWVKGVMAHEFQHLVNFTPFFDTVNASSMNSWLNESFSGYIEMVLYPTAMQDGDRYNLYHRSNLVRNGQSLYNFNTSYSDIGVYGSVFYFSQYLEKMAGKNIFSQILTYWRESYSSTLSTSEALAESVPDSLYKKIDDSINYDALRLSFASESDEWMSKLTLNFYLSTLAKGDNVSEFSHINQTALLYDSIDSANIEGGGRVILALSGNTFDIPSGSDSGLIYIGLDKNFQPITEFVYK